MRFIRLPELITMLSVSKPTIWRWVSQGKFPKPTKLGERTSAWSVADVEQWIAQRQQGGAA
jgi:prophage regulatory protein